eukprot:sb/3462518/
MSAQMIRAGCEAFAKSVSRARVEEELLPQCWEQGRLEVSMGSVPQLQGRHDVTSDHNPYRQIILDHHKDTREEGVGEGTKWEDVRNSEEGCQSIGLTLFSFLSNKCIGLTGRRRNTISDKFVERRILVSETCGTLSAHLSSDVCSSLVLSILKQVLADKDESVRESGVRNIALLTTRIHNLDKTDELVSILMSVLSDSSTKVQETALQFYLPCLSVWLGDQFLSKLYFTLLSGVCSFIKTNNTRQCSTYIQTLTSCNVFLFTSLLRPTLDQKHQQQTVKKGEDDGSNTPPNSHLDLLNPCVILGVPVSDFKNAVSALNTSLVQGPLSEQCEWVKETAVPLLVTALKDAHDNHALKGISGLLQHLLNITGRPLIQYLIKPALATEDDPRVQRVLCTGILAVSEEDKTELRDLLATTLQRYSAQFLDIQPLTETIAELSQMRSTLHVLVDVLSTALREATNPHMKGTIATIAKGLCDNAEPNGVVTHVLPILTHLANDPDVFVQTSTVPAFAVMLQRCSGSVGGVREQMDKFISEAVSSDVHPMMCTLIESFTMVLPLCSPDIQRDFLIPRLATIGVSNSAISNKTKRRDITERLINAYKAILCSYLTPDTIEHYIVPGLQALLVDANEVIPEKQQTVDLMLKEIIAKTGGDEEGDGKGGQSRTGTAFGSKTRRSSREDLSGVRDPYEGRFLKTVGFEIPEIGELSERERFVTSGTNHIK